MCACAIRMGARGGMQSAMRQFCRNKWGKSKAAENLLASAADCFFLSSVRKYRYLDNAPMVVEP